MAAFRLIRNIAARLLAALLFGGAGLILGALIGGNFAPNFTFNGVQGYEATGQVGLLLGVIAGWFLSRRLALGKKSRPSDRRGG